MENSNSKTIPLFHVSDIFTVALGSIQTPSISEQIYCSVQFLISVHPKHPKLENVLTIKNCCDSPNCGLVYPLL